MNASVEGGRRKQVAGGALAFAALGVQVFADRAFPDLTTAQARLVLAACLIVGVLGLILISTTLLHSKKRPPRMPRRQWSTVGFGQGWIEHQVRNNNGATFGVTANPGGEADQIHFELTFSGRHEPRRAERVELIFEVDDRPFEFFATDEGTANFSLRTQVWRDLEAFRELVAALRRGRSLWVTAPALALAAEFTLDGAFDVLAEVETLGNEPGFETGD